VDGFTVTEEWADLVLSATLVAVIVAVVDELTLGAVNTPSLEIAPALALQLTPVFDVFVTEAAKRWLPPDTRLDEVGETATLTATAGFTVIVDCACLVGSATLVAVTLAVAGAVTLGAVNTPLLDIVPPLALQVTAVFEVLLTVAVNCWVAPEMRLEEVGETTTPTPVVGLMITLALACLVGSATLVAVTDVVKVVEKLRAVNKPLLVIVPPSALHVIPRFDVLLTVAENCWVPPDGMLTLPGEMATLTTMALLTVM
jgi:hypothetical protein